MNSLWCTLGLLSLVFSTGVFADDREKGQSNDKDHKEEHSEEHSKEHSKDKDGKRTFTVDKTNGQAPLVVTFNSSNIKSAKKFSWSFGDGQTLITTASVVTHTYTQAGSYTAGLKYAVNASNKELKTYKDAGSVLIKVLNTRPVASLNCTTNNLLVNCNALGSFDPEGQALSYSFDYADGFIESSTSGLSSHAYGLPGLYTVSLTVTDFTGLSTTITTTVQPLLPPNILPSLALNCSSLKPNNISCNGQGSSDSDGTIVSYRYSFDDGIEVTSADTGSVKHIFSSGGNHTVTLTAVDNDGGVSSLQKNFTVLSNTNPIANFTCTSTKPLEVNCQSTSIDADIPLDAFTQFTWTLNNEVITSFTDSTLQYTFSSGGNFDIILSVKDSYGGSASITKTISVKENIAPSVELFASSLNGVAPLAINFEARNAVDVDGSIVNYQWSFSDGGVASGANVSHTFTTIGNFTATLKVKDNLGAVTTKTVAIETLEPLKFAPTAFFKYFEKGTYVELHASLNRSQFEIDHAFYTIDNNQTVALTEFYPNTVNMVNLISYGQHVVSLTVVDKRGQTSVFTHEINLLEDPSSLNPYVDFSSVQSGARTIFLNLNPVFNPDPMFGIKNFHIDFGDNASVNVTDDTFATHTYLNSGTYDVTVTATTSQETVASITKSITVTNENVAILNPVAQFGYEIYDFAQNVSFYNERSGTPNGTIISYLWDFGDGTTATGDRVAHFYNPGSYLVTLTVTDSAGLRSSQTQHVTIYAAGSDFIANIECDDTLGFTANCTVTALDKFNQISSVRVTWGDATANTLTTPLVPGQGIYKRSHTYTLAKNYTITLTVSTSRGVNKSMAIVKTITPPPPIAVINCTMNFLTASCNAQGTTDPSGQGIESYSFNFGDDFETAPSTLGSAQHTYATAGSYPVKLTVKSRSGMISIASTTVLAQFAPPIANLNCSVSGVFVNCNGTGSYDSYGSTLSYVFDYSDGFIEVNSTGISNHKYSQIGQFTINLTVTSSLGLVAYASKDITTTNMAPIADGYCNSYSPETITCLDSSFDPDNSGPISIKWSVDNQASSNIMSFFKLYSSGIKTVLLEVTDFKGAISSKTFTVAVAENIAPVAVANCSVVDQKFLKCVSNSYDTDGEIIKTKWTLSNGLIYLGDQFEVEILNENLLNYTLLVSDESGKQNSVSNSIAINLNSSLGNVTDNCPISNILKNRACANEYYQANSMDDIADYLNQGKFNQYGDLLNLQINNSVESNSLKISTPCKLKILGNISIENSTTNTCIRASGVDIVDTNINIESTKPTYILSENYINISKTNIVTDNEAVLKSFNKDFFFADVSIINNSHLSASKIDISSFFINLSESSNFDAGLITIDGNDCSEKLNFISDKCNQNLIKQSYKIESNQELDSLVMNFNIPNLESELVRWSIDGHEYQSASNSFSFTPQMPGTYKVEAVIQNDDGNFRRISNIINVQLIKTYKFKTQAFKFYNSYSSPHVINAFLNNQAIELHKSNIDPEIYLTKFISAHENSLSFSVISQGYSSSLKVEELQINSDPEILLNDIISQYSVDDQQIDSSLLDLNSSVSSAIEEMKSLFNSLNPEEKLEFITLVKVNLQRASDSNVVFSRKLKKENYFYNFLLNSAFASDDSASFADRFINTNMQDYLASDIITRGAGVVITICGLAVIQLEPTNLGRAAGLMTSLVGIRILLKEHNRRTYIINNIYALNDDNISINTLSDDSSFTFSISAVLDPVNDESLSTSKKLYRVLKENKAFNILIKKINNAVSVSNTFLGGLSDKFYIKTIPLLTFPSRTKQGELDPNFIKDISISSFEYYGVEIENKKVVDGEIRIDISSFKPQSVTLLFHYFNPDLDIDKFVSKNITLPGLINRLSYKQGNRDIELTLLSSDSEVITYNGLLNFKWEYGDGEVSITSSPISFYRYNDAGTYTLKLTVSDSDFNELFSQSVSILIRDRSYYSIAGDEKTLVDYYLSPYSGYSGYMFKRTDEIYGTCYSNGITYPSTEYPDTANIEWFNCSIGNLRP